MFVKKKIPVLVENIRTGEKIEFRSIKKARDFFEGLYNVSVSNEGVKRIINQSKPYRGEWRISCINEEDAKEIRLKKTPNLKKRVSLVLINLKTGELRIFEATSVAERYFRESNEIAGVGGFNYHVEKKSVIGGKWIACKCDEKITINPKHIEKIKKYDIEVETYRECDGRFVAGFKDINEASCSLNISRSSLLKAFNRRGKTNGYYIFRKGEIPPWEVDECFF